MVMVSTAGIHNAGNSVTINRFILLADCEGYLEGIGMQKATS